MTDTEPSTRPIHERWSEGPTQMRGLVEVELDGVWLFWAAEGHEADAVRALLAAAGKVHAVLVDLPDVAGGGQLVTWSYPNGAVEASWRPTRFTSDGLVPVENLNGGAVRPAP